MRTVAAHLKIAKSKTNTQTARYIGDQSDLQKTQVPFSGFSNYRPVSSDREKTDHPFHQDSSNFSLKAQRNPLKSLQLAQKRRKWFVCVQLYTGLSMALHSKILFLLSNSFNSAVLV